MRVIVHPSTWFIDKYLIISLTRYVCTLSGWNWDSISRVHFYNLQISVCLLYRGSFWDSDDLKSILLAEPSYRHIERMHYDPVLIQKSFFFIRRVYPLGELREDINIYIFCYSLILLTPNKSNYLKQARMHQICIFCLCIGSISQRKPFLSGNTFQFNSQRCINFATLNIFQYQ